MSTPAVSYNNHRFSPDIITHAVWLYYRFSLSLRLVEEMLLERGIVASCEAIRRWGRKFGPAMCADCAANGLRGTISGVRCELGQRTIEPAGVDAPGRGNPLSRTYWPSKCERSRQGVTVACTMVACCAL
jgi:hypothetical protein